MSPRILSPRDYKLLHSLVSPEQPKDKTYSEIVEVVKKHYSPAPSEIVERFKFHSRVRKDEATYVAELAENCNFGDSLSTMLLDRLVCGINSETMQKRLLAESKLTLDDALKIATRMEAATRGAQELHVTSEKFTVNKVGNSSASANVPRYVNCFRCGSTEHKADTCRFKKVTCRNCGRLGHIQKACKSPGRPSGPPTCNNCGKLGHMQRYCELRSGKNHKLLETSPQQEKTLQWNIK